MPRLKVRPIGRDAANEYVATHHRHHKPVVGYKFALAAVDAQGNIRGVLIAGRPVARRYNDRHILEVTRLCTDGTRNACSLLYGAAARVAREMGYEKIITYILDTEPGTSLRAAGWIFEAISPGGAWKRSDGAPRSNDHPLGPKQRWARIFSASAQPA